MSVFSNWMDSHSVSFFNIAPQETLLTYKSTPPLLDFLLLDQDEQLILSLDIFPLHFSLFKALIQSYPSRGFPLCFFFWQWVLTWLVLLCLCVAEPKIFLAGLKKTSQKSHNDTRAHTPYIVAIKMDYYCEQLTKPQFSRKLSSR